MYEEFNILSNIALFENKTNSQKFDNKTRFKFDPECDKKPSPDISFHCLLKCYIFFS